MKAETFPAAIVSLVVSSSRKLLPRMGANCSAVYHNIRDFVREFSPLMNPKALQRRRRGAASDAHPPDRGGDIQIACDNVRLHWCPASLVSYLCGIASTRS